MAIRDVETTHDLATFLEETARLLRAIPPILLAEGKAFDEGIEVATEHGRGNKEAEEDTTHAALAEKLQELGRENAQDELQSLTVDGIRRTAASLGIRIPSKSKKSDAIDLVLAQVFDMPAGQELLRTFHKRNADNRPPPSRIRKPNHSPRRNEMKK